MLLQILLQVETAITLAEKGIENNNVTYIFLAIIVVFAFVIVFVFRMYKSNQDASKQLLADTIVDLRKQLEDEKRKTDDERKKAEENLKTYINYVVEAERINKQNYSQLELLIKNLKSS